MKTYIGAAIVMAVLSGCADTIEVDPGNSPARGQVRLGEPVRGHDDPCKFVSKSRQLKPYRSSYKSLAACPAGYEGLDDFTLDIQATRLTEANGYVIFGLMISDS